MRKLARTGDLRDTGGFERRCEAMERLEMVLVAARDWGGAALLARARSAWRQLERANNLEVHRLLQRIHDGTCIRSDLVAELKRYRTAERGDVGIELKYDSLDVLVAGILGTDRFHGTELREVIDESIPYQPTPARVVLDLVDLLDPSPSDVFVDIGSGLGVVPTLVSLLTGTPALGIELQASYVKHADACAQRVNASGVRFMCQDAAEMDLSVGTVFYMYTPFKGRALHRFLVRLHSEGLRRHIRVCTYGPHLTEALLLPEFGAFARDGAIQGPIAIYHSNPMPECR